MSDQRNGGIAWCDETWNPIRGCSKASQGCRNCYAETMAARFSGPGQPYEGTITNDRWNGTVKLVPERLVDPLRWRRPRRIFVNSMSDLFHESLSNEDIAAVFGVMAAASAHTFQVLTKRPERAVEWFKWVAEQAEILCNAVGLWPDAPMSATASACVIMAERMMSVESEPIPPWMARVLRRAEWPLPNVWLGVSVEDQAAADERIPLLQQCPAAVRWVSVEPMLGRIDLSRWVFDRHKAVQDAQYGPSAMNEYQADAVIGYPLDWVVVGGESGPGARPMHPEWARALRDQCAAAGVPFLFKQWGEWRSAELGCECHKFADSWTTYHWHQGGPVATCRPGRPEKQLDERTRALRVGKKAAGRLLDGVLHDAYPEVKP